MFHGHHWLALPSLGGEGSAVLVGGEKQVFHTRTPSDLCPEGRGKGDRGEESPEEESKRAVPSALKDNQGKTVISYSQAEPSHLPLPGREGHHGFVTTSRGMDPRDCLLHPSGGDRSSSSQFSSSKPTRWPARPTVHPPA